MANTKKQANNQKLMANGKTFLPIFLVSTGLIASLSLTGCATNGTVPTANKAQIGALGGAAAGGLLGNQFGKGDGKTIMTIAGAIIGGYLGGMWGQAWDANDRRYMGTSVTTNQPVSWQNGDTRYKSTPSATYQGSMNGVATECKDVYIDGYNPTGQHRQMKAKACRSPQTGQWVFQS
ncbi:MAG: glycine zipper 2TM domain-containing protein [bacterium]